MDLYALFESLERTPVAAAIRESVWLFPAVEAVHLLGLALLGGTVLIVDLRLLGAGLTAQPPSQVERAARPWLLSAIVVMVLTGVPLALSEAVKLYDKEAYWLKMSALACALVFTFAVRNPTARRDMTGLSAKAVGALSLALWLTVATAGRWIGFS